MALEFDEQLSRLEKPNRNEMTNKEYAVFNENVETMEKNWGFINNLFKVLPLNASQYIGFLDFQGSLFNPDTCYLTNADKEMIGVVVSSINCCSYCLTTHGDALRGYTKNPMLVDKLCYNFRSAKDLLTEKQYALCEYAWYVTKHADEIDETQIENLRKAGLIAIVLREEDELIGVELTDETDELMLATRMGQAIRFSETDIRAMGRNSMGVKSIDLAENDEVISVARVEEGKQVLAITQNGYGKRTDISEFRLQSRGGKGIMAMRLTDKTGLMAAQLLVHEDEDIMLITDDGTIIRMPVSGISTIGRVSQGVRVMRVEDESRIVCVTATERDEDESGEEDGEDSNVMEPVEQDSLDMDVGEQNSENQPEETDE